MWQRELQRPTTLNPNLLKALRPGEDSSMTQNNFMSWKRNCRAYGKMRKLGAGIFCSSFMTRGAFPHATMSGAEHTTKWAWPTSSLFREIWKKEEYDRLEVAPEEELQYQRGRDGDHLIGVYFDYDLCHFHNLTMRDPQCDRFADEYELICIWRAILDAM